MGVGVGMGALIGQKLAWRQKREDRAEEEKY